MRNYPLSVLLTALLLLSLSCVVHAQRIQQPLGRGVVVSKGASGLLISWRKLAQEPENATYNVYVNGTLLNAAPVSKTNLRPGIYIKGGRKVILTKGSSLYR